MNETKAISTPQAEPPKFLKRIGRTVYEVNIHFNANSTEELHKKVERLILNDVKKSEFF